MRACPECATELDEVYSAAASPQRDLERYLPRGDLKYACPGCEAVWRRSPDGRLISYAMPAEIGKVGRLRVRPARIRKPL